MLFVLGAGGFAKEVALAVASTGDKIDGYLSDDPKQTGEKLVFGKCLGSIEAAAQVYSGERHSFVPGIGNPTVRRELVNRALRMGWEPITIFDKDSLTSWDIANKAHFDFGMGSVFCRGTSVTVDIRVGNYVNVNLNCTLGHDCILEDYVNLSPSVNVSGYVHIEEDVDIGTGAVILPHVRIGKGAIIGAGAVVNKDVPAGEVWVGIPARKIK